MMTLSPHPSSARAALMLFAACAAWPFGCASTLDASRAPRDAAADTPADLAAPPDVPAPLDVPAPPDVAPPIDLPAPPDAAPPDVPAPLPGRYEVTADTICGVAAFRSYALPDFFSVYATQRGGLSELHLVRFTRDGAFVFDRTLVASSLERLCVSRRSIGVLHWGTPARDDLAIAWTAANATERMPRGTIVDVDGAQRGALVFDSTDADALPTEAENLLLSASGSSVGVAYEGMQHYLRARRFDLTRPEPMIGEVPRFTPVDSETIGGYPTQTGPLVISENRVAFARSVAGRPVLSVRYFSFTAFGAYEPVDLPTDLENPTPVSFGELGDNRMLYRGGVRDVTLRVVSDILNPMTQRTIASNTAWNTTDSELDTAYDVDLWISHGRIDGYNRRVILAPPTATDFDRCTLFLAVGDTSQFRQVARARFGGRQQLIAAIEHRVTGSSAVEVLHERVLGDGEGACPPMP